METLLTSESINVDADDVDVVASLMYLSAVV